MYVAVLHMLDELNFLSISKRAQELCVEFVRHHSFQQSIDLKRRTCINFCLLNQNNYSVQKIAARLVKRKTGIRLNSLECWVQLKHHHKLEQDGTWLTHCSWRMVPVVGCW